MLKNNTFELIMTTGLLSAMLIAPAAYAEDIINAENPDAILNIARGFGYATLGKDSQGDPKISGRVEGTRYGIYFYGCSEGKNCNQIQFATGWGEIKVPMDEINEWNRKRRYGKAYLDKDGDPMVEMMVNINYGVTTKNLEDTFDWWTKVMKDFGENVVKKR